MEWRALRGAFDEPGPATVWARQRVGLVAGEEPTALQRLLTVADSGNGVSNLLDPRRWWFINTELTVHLHREPAASGSASTPHGDRHATRRHRALDLHDQTGPVAAGAQALLVRPR